jgi:hypothetical protein
MLVETKMKLPRPDVGTVGETEYDIPHLYGPTVRGSVDKCAGYDSTNEAAEAQIFWAIFTTAAYASALSTPKNDVFWTVVLLQDFTKGHLPFFGSLSIVVNEWSQSIRTKEFKTPRSFFHYHARPLVRHRLLEALRDSMSALSGEVAP